MLLTCHRELPGISVNALRLSLRNNEGVTKEDAELAVGGDRVGLNHQHDAGLKHLLVLFGLDVVGEDMRLGADEIDAVNVDGPPLDSTSAIKESGLEQLVQMMAGSRHVHHALEAPQHDPQRAVAPLVF